MPATLLHICPGDELLAANAAPSTPTSLPDLPEGSSTTQSMADDVHVTNGPQAASASAASRPTQGSLDGVAASASPASKTSVPAAGAASQVGSRPPSPQQQPHTQSETPFGLAPAPYVQPITAHPLHPLRRQPSESHSAASTPPSEPLQTELRQGGVSSQLPQDKEASTSDANVQDTARTAAEAAFAVWLSAAEHSEWAVLEYVGYQVVPALIGSLRMVASRSETEALRCDACTVCCLCLTRIKAAIWHPHNEPQTQDLELMLQGMVVYLSCLLFVLSCWPSRPRHDNLVGLA